MWVDCDQDSAFLRLTACACAFTGESPWQSRGSDSGGLWSVSFLDKQCKIQLRELNILWITEWAFGRESDEKKWNCKALYVGKSQTERIHQSCYSILGYFSHSLPPHSHPPSIQLCQSVPWHSGPIWLICWPDFVYDRKRFAHLIGFESNSTATCACHFHFKGLDQPIFLFSWPFAFPGEVVFFFSCLPPKCACWTTCFHPPKRPILPVLVISLFVAAFLSHNFTRIFWSSLRFSS